MELNFEALEVQKWNIPTDRAQKIEEKNGFICLFIMFTPRVAVIKNGSFFVFSGITEKNQPQLRRNIKVHLKDLI